MSFMNKKVDLDELMYLLGEENTLEKFNKDSYQHKFSEKYEMNRMKMINNEDNINSTKEITKKKKSTFKRAMILTAAVTAALGVSLTVYGVGKRFSFTTSKNEETGTLTHNIITDAPLNKIQEIKVTPQYLPAGYIESTNSPGKYHLNDDWEQGGITICSGFNSTNLKDLYVSTVEDTTIGGVKAQIVTREGIDYKYIVYLFYEEDGQIVKLYATNKVPLDELVKVAENITYEVVPNSYVPLQTVKEVIPNNTPSSKINPDIISTSKLFNVGDEMNNFKGSLEGLKYTVNSIEVLDKLPELNPEGFIDYQLYQNSINKNGTLKPYERTIKKYWDNNKMNTDSETIAMKFVYVTLDLTNPLGDDKIDMYFCPIIAYMNKCENNTLQFIPIAINNSHNLQGESTSMYCDKLDYPGSHRRFINMPANSTERVTLVFAIDEDRLDKAYIGFNRLASTDKITPDYRPTYIKITK